MSRAARSLIAVLLCLLTALDAWMWLPGILERHAMQSLFPGMVTPTPTPAKR